MKRIITITIAIILVAGLAAGAWFFLKNRGNEVIKNQVTTVERIGSASPTLLAGRALAGYWEDTRTHTRYEITENGDMYRKPENGEAAKIEGVPVLDTRVIFPSASGRFAVVHFGESRVGVFSIFNADDHTWIPLPEGTEAVAR